MSHKVLKHKRFDTHVHIWSTPDDEKFKPNPKYPLVLERAPLLTARTRLEPEPYDSRLSLPWLGPRQNRHAGPYSRL